MLAPTIIPYRTQSFFKRRNNDIRYFVIKQILLFTRNH